MILLLRGKRHIFFNLGENIFNLIHFWQQKNGKENWKKNQNKTLQPPKRKAILLMEGRDHSSVHGWQREPCFEICCERRGWPGWLEEPFMQVWAIWSDRWTPLEEPRRGSRAAVSIFHPAGTQHRHLRIELPLAAATHCSAKSDEYANSPEGWWFLFFFFFLRRIEAIFFCYLFSCLHLRELNLSWHSEQILPFQNKTHTK